ncbi:MAG TPA: carbohydrate ABC transporter permease [Gemmatimonadales bacterium]|nr:carbohydrate ABC transporter permease [Gemmatimonadales bacterium]
MTKHRGASIALHVALGLAALGTLFPLLWMVSGSFMATGEANSFPPRLFPAHPTFSHYAALFTRLNVGKYFLNSVIVAGGATAISLFFNSMAGYALAKLHFKGRAQLFRVLVAGLVIPAQVAMLPLFLVLQAMGLVNTYVGAMIPAMATIFGIFLIRQYAMGIPDDLLSAARMDGAGEFRIYWSIVMPVIKPILATMALFTFLSTWNDFLWPLVALTDDAKYTLPVALAGLAGEHVQDTELMLAGSVVTVLPVLIAFIALQRFYVEGITAGSVKQ